jgi:hypothetical protein
MFQPPSSLRDSQCDPITKCNENCRSRPLGLYHQFIVIRLALIFRRYFVDLHVCQRLLSCNNINSWKLLTTPQNFLSNFFRNFPTPFSTLSTLLPMFELRGSGFGFA